MIEGLIPADPTRCQAEIRPAHSPLAFGPRPKMERCKNVPVVIATETKPGQDGLTGSMSVCAECLVVMLERFPKDFFRLKPAGNAG